MFDDIQALLFASRFNLVNFAVLFFGMWLLGYARDRLRPVSGLLLSKGFLEFVIYILKFAARAAFSGCGPSAMLGTGSVRYPGCF
jgi:hypothetical protein